VAADEAARGFGPGPKGAVAQRDELQAGVDAARDIGIGWKERRRVGDRERKCRSEVPQASLSARSVAIPRPPKYSTTAFRFDVV
jgi:hypothetical protein